MAFDGFVISNLTNELNQALTGGRITKIAQPEEDELLLTIVRKNPQASGTFKLFISVGASLPFACLTKENKPSPLTAPNFCMLLRKHLNSARILSVTQPGLERVIDIKIEHLNEMGDICVKHLMAELMGKHSNLIFIDDENKIIDSMKHISGFVSSVREVLPGREYFIPKTEGKFRLVDTEENSSDDRENILNRESFFNVLLKKPLPIAKTIYTGITGISPLLAQEICHRAGIDGDMPCQGIDTDMPLSLQRNESPGEALFKQLIELKSIIENKEYHPNIVYRRQEDNSLIPLDFSSISLTALLADKNCEAFPYDSVSSLLEEFYAAKNALTRIRQKSTDLRKIVTTSLDRCRKKFDLQTKQMEDTKKMDKFKIYGELLNAYGYNISDNSEGSSDDANKAKKTTSFTCHNYYTDEEITIPIAPELTGPQNAKKYFDRYQKLKRTSEALNVQMKETAEEIEHLESILTALDIARKPEDLVELKEELTQYGYMRRRTNIQKKGRISKKDYGSKKKERVTSKPFHYISSDGFHIYVGKNNFQNDMLTFKMSSGNDWWFHAKKIPGSHVLVKSNGEELPDRTFEEAASLAAHYSQGKSMQKVEIDYVEKKHVKKPNGAKPGFVIYHTNYSMVASPDISGLKSVEE